MDCAGKLNRMNARGFTLSELVVVVAIIGLLLSMAGMSFRTWYDKYKAESQIRMLHADLMQARVSAMQKNKEYFVVINGSNYQVVEDANENGANDDPALEQKTMRYPATSSVTVIMDTKGLISTTTSSLVNHVDIKFNTGSATPEYNCIQLYATRINLGRLDGSNCVPR
jgi:prepilin-type N-terminal cleavage/methylation domain-containing protein